MPESGKDPERVNTGRIGGLTSWDRTENRDVRMAHVRGHSPADDSWHAARLGLDISQPLTDEQLARIRTSKKLYFAQLRRSSASKSKDQTKERLRALRARLEREAGDE